MQVLRRQNLLTWHGQQKSIRQDMLAGKIRKFHTTALYPARHGVTGDWAAFSVLTDSKERAKALLQAEATNHGAEEHREVCVYDETDDVEDEECEHRAPPLPHRSDAGGGHGARGC